MNPRVAGGWLAAILVVYLLLGAAFAVLTPAWQAPDEPAHYNYVRYVAEQGGFPVLHMGDYPHAYLEQIKAAGFPPDMPVNTIRYEFHQPPLYYVLAAPVYSVTRGNLTAVRLFSVFLGAGIVLLAYAIGRRIFPARPALALGAAAFVAFLPQHLATVSQVGNDVLAELLFAAVLYVVVGWVVAEDGAFRAGTAGRGDLAPTPWLVGVLLGLILITKTTAYIAVPLVGVVLLWRWRREWMDGSRVPGSMARRVAHDLLAVGLPAALIAFPWFARNIWAYGWPDVLGLRRHDEIVVGQTRAAQFIADSGWAAYARRTLEWTFKSFWGVFGWMGVWLDSRFYFLAALLSGTALGGTVLGLVRRHRTSPTPAGRAARFLTFSAVLTLVAYAWYNLTFLQHQGRYLFTALIPLALAYAWGWEGALQPCNARLLAGALAVFAVSLAAWGVVGPAGLPKWPLALTVALGGGLVIVSFLPARLRGLAYAGVIALLPLLAAYALYTGIVGQLGQFGG